MKMREQPDRLEVRIGHVGSLQAADRGSSAVGGSRDSRSHGRDSDQSFQCVVSRDQPGFLVVERRSPTFFFSTLLTYCAEFSFTQHAGNIDCRGTGVTKTYAPDVCVQDMPPVLHTKAIDLTCCSRPSDPECKQGVPSVSVPGAVVFHNGQVISHVE